LEKEGVKLLKRRGLEWKLRRVEKKSYKRLFIIGRGSGPIPTVLI
jgi:hypothetical protein